MKKVKGILGLSLICGSMLFSNSINAMETETILHNKDGIVLKLKGDNTGVFKVYVKNETNKDMFNVSLFSEDIKGFKLVEGRTLNIGNVKANEEKILDEKVIKYEMEKIIEDAVKNNSLAKTSVSGVYKIFVPLAICGMVGMVYIVLTNKKNKNKILSALLATSLLSTVFVDSSNAKEISQNEIKVGAKVLIENKEYDYVGVFLWSEKENTNEINTATEENKKDDENEKEKEKEEKDTAINFEDENLKNIILKLLKEYDGENSNTFSLLDKNYRKDKNSNEIFKSDLEKIEILNLDLETRYDMDFEENITSIVGIENAKNLKTLILSNNEIENISALGYLENLEILKLDYNKIKDISSISNLKKLEELDLTSNNVKDITPLGDVLSLKKLIFSNPNPEDFEEKEVSRISDISAIGKLVNLEFLRLSHNDIEDISSLSNLKNLKELYISHNLIENISPISDLINLTDLDFAKNKVTQIDAIKDLVNLKTLTITGGKGDHDKTSNKISNIDFVKNLKNLTYFWALNNEISDLTALENLNSLINLSLENNKISNIDVLKNLENIETLNIAKNEISNIEALKDYKKISELDFSNNVVEDIDALKNLESLKNLYMKNNEISSVLSLKNLLNLEILDFSNNNVKNLDGIENLTNIYNLEFSNNKIKDISILENLTSLNEIEIDENEIFDFSVIEKLSNLYYKNISKQNVNVNKVLESDENSFELDNPFVNLDNLYENTSPIINVENENISVSFDKENNKFKIVHNGDFTEDNLTFSLNYGEDVFTVSGITLKKLEKEEYIDIEDELFLKVLNKNIDKNRTGDEKIKKSELEKLTKISVYLDENGKSVPILELKSLKDTEDFKFAVSSGIKSIKGIEFAKNLEELNLEQNEISDISYLSNLKNLKKLILGRNRIKDVTPLENLTNLEFLKLYNNLIEDISSLKNLVNLKGLDVHYNVTVSGSEDEKIISKGITDISVVENFLNLEYLDVSSNRISDVSFIKNLEKITTLDFGGNNVGNYEGLSEYIVTRYLNQMNGDGSIGFFGQTINYDETINVNNKNFEIDSHFKGIKEISDKLAEAFEAEDLNLFENIESDVDGISVIFNKETNKFEFTLSDEFLQNNNEKNVNVNLKITLDDMNWFVKNINLNVKDTVVTFSKFTDTLVERGTNSVEGRVFGKNLENLKIFAKEIVNGKEIETTDVTLEIVSSTEKNANVKLNFKENNTENDKNYRIYFGDKNDVFVDVVVEKFQKTEVIDDQIPEIFTSISDDTLIENISDTARIKVFGKNLDENIKIFVKEITENGEIDSTDLFLSEVVGSSKTNRYLMIKTKKVYETDKNYKVYLGFEEKTNVFQNITLKGEPKTITPIENKPEILDSNSPDDVIENISDTATVRILGTKLTDDVKIFVKEVTENGEIDSTDLFIENVSGLKASNKIIKIKTNKIPSSDKIYKVYFGYESATNIFEEITVKKNPNEEETNTPTETEETFNFIKAFYQKDGRNFRIEFEEELKNENISNLKSKIKFLLDGREISLKSEDTVEISGKNVKIILNEPMNVFDILFSKINIEKGALKSVTDKISDKVDSNFTLETVKEEKITGYEIDKYVVENSGGNVKIRFLGENLKENSVNIKLINVENRTPETEINSKITFEMISNDLVATLPLSENTLNQAKSFSLSIKNSKNQDINEKAEILTVLANGQEISETIFSDIDIKSYKNNQSVGSESLNVKHTEVSEGQQSKKTWGTIYGANLDFRKIDVKITDNKGVVWPLVNSSVHGENKYFKYLGGNPTTTVSIKGEGTNVTYEILLPNNLDEDRTFTYEFLIDGKKVEDAKVTAFVKKTSSDVVSTEIKTITVKYQDENFKKIKEDTILNGYSFLPYSIETPEIDGYEFSEVKDLEKLNGDNFGESRDIILIYNLDNKVVVNETNKDFYFNLFNEYSNFEKKYKNLTDEANEKFSKENKPLKTKEITKEDMKMLKTFKVIKENVDDNLVSPLKYAQNLEEFEVLLNSHSVNRSITDFSVLENTKLTKFYYVNQDYKNSPEKIDIDLTPVSNIKTLKDVRITFTNLKNLEYFKNLDLTNLSLEDNEISDITLISNLQNLERLDLENNKITDISPISSLKKLVTLYLNGNNIENISPLVNVKSLEALLLQNTNILNINILKKLPNLHRLRIDKNENLQENYFDVVKELNGLNTIFVGKINLEDFDWLKNFLSREEVLAKYDEDKIRMGNFDLLEINLNKNRNEILENKITIENPLKDFENLSVFQDENESGNENLTFEENNITISNISQLEKENKIIVEYKIFIENYETAYGDYSQPASLSGKVKIIINLEDSVSETETETGLPRKFDLRNVDGKNYITSVKNQYKDGGCRSFASLGALESHILMKTGENLDLSENNMEIRHGYYYNGKPSPENARLGRTRESDIGYLISNKGPYLEIDDEYRPFLQNDIEVENGISKEEYYRNLKPNEDEYSSEKPIGVITGKNIPYRVTGFEFLKTIDTTTLTSQEDIKLAQIKKAIIENGAVVTDIYISHDGKGTFPYTNEKYYNPKTFAYYTDGNDGKYISKYQKQSNHAVTIVGWDDDFSKDNFITKPSIDGAWIVKDSQGENFGENGFYYVSFASVSMTENPYVFTNVVKGDEYKKIYQHDEIPFSSYIKSDNYIDGKSILFNRYKSNSENEILTDIGFFTTKPNAEYEIYLIPNFDEFKNKVENFFEDEYEEYYQTIQEYKIFSGIKEKAGYHLMKLENELDLSLNKDFLIGIWTKNLNIEDSKWDMVVETSKFNNNFSNYGRLSNQLENQTYTFSFDGFVDLNARNINEKINASIKGYVKNK